MSARQHFSPSAKKRSVGENEIEKGKSMADERNGGAIEPDPPDIVA